MIVRRRSGYGIFPDLTSFQTPNANAQWWRDNPDGLGKYGDMKDLYNQAIALSQQIASLSSDADVKDLARIASGKEAAIVSALQQSAANFNWGGSLFNRSDANQRALDSALASAHSLLQDYNSTMGPALAKAQSAIAARQVAAQAAAQAIVDQQNAAAAAAKAASDAATAQHQAEAAAAQAQAAQSTAAAQQSTAQAQVAAAQAQQTIKNAQAPKFMGVKISTLGVLGAVAAGGYLLSSRRRS